MKIVRLKTDQLREWRRNTSFLVDDEGHLVTEIDSDLERAVSMVTRSARSQRKTLEQAVTIGSGKTARQHLVRVEVLRTGIDSGDFSVETNVDGHRVVPGRTVMAARLLAEHGECQLRAPNGVILKVVRDPGTHRPSFAESQQIAPKPEHCPCKVWGRPHPGVHYPTCQWNRLAPPEEQASSSDIPEAEIKLLPTEAFASLERRPVITAATSPIAARVSASNVVVEPPPLDAPESCRNGCRDWATPKGFPVPAGQHHPTCTFHKPWAIATSRAVPRWLIDLHTGEKVRLASDAEIGQSDIAAQKTGSPIIHLDERPYAVVLETELDDGSAGSADALPERPLPERPLPEPVLVVEATP